MRALTLLEPWATLVARGLKTVETRGRPVGLRVGEEFAVHAGMRLVDPSLHRDVLRWAGLEPSTPMSYGRIVAVATVLAVEESDGGMASAWKGNRPGEEYADARRREYALGNFAPGRTLYVLDAHGLRSGIRCRGAQGVWPLPREVEDALRGAARSGRR